MKKNENFICIVSDCPKFNECARYVEGDYQALCLTYNCKFWRNTKKDFSCFIKSLESEV